MAGPWEDYAPAEAVAGPWTDYAPSGDERPFLEKLGAFARNVIANPPPSVAGIRDVIRDAPAAARELTFGDDPEAARAAAGIAAQAAGLGLGFRGLGGEGVAARPIVRPAAAPVPTPVLPQAAAPPSETQAALQAFGRLNVEVPRYIATESTVLPQVAASVKNAPWAGQPVVRSADKLMADLNRAAGDIAPATTPELAGERAKTGLTSFIGTGSQKPVGEAYKTVDALIDPNVRVPLENTRAAIAEIMARDVNARKRGRSAAVEMVIDAVQDPRGLNYAGVKDLRTSIGEKTPVELANKGIAKTDIDRIYASMSKDLGAVVRQSSPEAFTAWQEANALARLTSLQREALTKVTGTKGDAAPEAVFERLTTYAKSKAGADLRRLQLAKRAMGPEAWTDVGSAMINRLGRAAPDAEFSPQRFATAWGNLSGAAKQELFSGQQAAALSDLFLASRHVGERITKFANPSGTSRGVFGVLGGTAALADPISVIGGMVGTRLVASALSKPAVVRAATAVSRASATGNPMATRRALAQLERIVALELGAAGQQQSGR